MTTVRLAPLTTAVTAAAAAIYNQGYPDSAIRPTDFAQRCNDGGSVWVLLRGTNPIAVAALTPAPGLPGVFDLELAVDRPHRRQGWGSRLLALLLDTLRGGNVQQIACGLDDIGMPAARFLLANSFSVEHEEWILLRPDLADLPDTDPALAARVRTLPRATAVDTFLPLYDAIFAPTPWNQPFSRAELVATLDDAADLLFLFDDTLEHPIGLAWLRMEAGRKGVVEPLGIVGAEQGRGYGRGLLTISLHALKQRGAQRAQIGAWRTNQRAIHLYQSLGFRHIHTRTYLSRSVQHSDSGSSFP